jgi:hypothetical protein
MLEAGYYVAEPRPDALDAPGGLVRRAAPTSPSLNPPEMKTGPRGPVVKRKQPFFRD